MSRRRAGSITAYMKRPAPARLALAVLAVTAIAVIVLGSLYVVRRGNPAQLPAPRWTSPSACPTPPPGYSPCDPIPTNTGFQTGDVG